VEKDHQEARQYCVDASLWQSEAWNMNSAKYACPFCGQNIEYTAEYSGTRMPCPTCQQTIMFPGLRPTMTRSSLRLARDIPPSAPKPRSSFGVLLDYLRRLVNRKPLAIGLLCLLFVGGALLAYPRVFHSTDLRQAPPPMLAVASDNESIPVDPPDPPPAAAEDSIPVASQPVSAAPTPPASTAPKAARAARGARGGNAKQAGARGRTPKKAKAPAANSTNQ
jgi:hypothetical protein